MENGPDASSVQRDAGRTLDFSIEVRRIDSVRPHAGNYQSHPEEQIVHLMASIERHGVFKNAVCTSDGTVLAGHGTLEAARRLGYAEWPFRVYDIAPYSTQAYEIMTTDNESDHLALRDDRALTEVLRHIREAEDGQLLGTGFDEPMVANLVMVTRPRSEIADFDAAAHWVGMPGYDDEDGRTKITMIVHFDSVEARAEFAEKLGLRLSPDTKSTWYPQRERDDLISVRFEG